MHGKTKSGARFHQSLDSPEPLLAEPEVLPHKQLPGSQPISQDLNHELVGRLRRELTRKRQANHDIHAGFFEEVQFLLRITQKLELHARRQYPEGMRLEGQNDGTAL